MNYQEALDAAKAAGMTNRLSSNRIDLKEEDSIVGKYLGRTEIKSTKRGYDDSFRYAFDLDQGPADLFFSGAFDNGVGADLHEGRVYSITFDEKVDIADGKTFKKFTVLEIVMEQAKEA